MAFNFTADCSITLADHAALTFPDDDWAIGGLVKFSTRTGSTDGFLFLWGSGYTNQFFARVGYASHAGFPDDVNLAFLDTDGTNLSLTTGSNEFQSNTSWTHILLERTSTTISVYKNGTLTGTVSNAGIDALDAGASFRFGNNNYNTGDFLGDMAEWAKWDRALTTAEKAMLCDPTKLHAPTFFPNSLKWYVPMINKYQELVQGIAVTNNGTTVSAHPRIIYPS